MLKLIHALDMNFNSVKNYYDSFIDKYSDLNCYAITQIVEGKKSYFDYIAIYEKNLYYLINENNPTYIIGFGTIKDTNYPNKDNLSNFGNIGYGIHPLERGKEYGTTLLNLLLSKCEKLGMNEVYVSCLYENIASCKIVRNNHGKLEKRFKDHISGKNALQYKIKLKPKLATKAKILLKKI